MERAVSLYDGKAFRKRSDDSEVYVCCECGSQQIEIQVWADANTEEYHSDVEDACNGNGVSSVRAIYIFVPKPNSSKNAGLVAIL